MLDFSVISAIGIIAAIILFVQFAMPYLRKNHVDIYEQVKLGLLIFGVAFRDDKVKKIADLVLTIVKQMEKLDLSPEEKLYLAIDEAFVTILTELNIELEAEVIEMLVHVAVSFLPPTNQPSIEEAPPVI